MTRTFAALAIAASTLATGMTAAHAQTLFPQGRYDSLQEVAMRGRSPVVVYRDSDGANAKNPALPRYERGRGQETGGPARNLIGR